MPICPFKWTCRNRLNRGKDNRHVNALLTCNEELGRRRRSKSLSVRSSRRSLRRLGNMMVMC